MRDGIGGFAQPAVGPVVAVRLDETATVGSELGDHVVEQGDGTVEPVGVRHVRVVQQEFGPAVARRKVVPAEGIGVGRSRQRVRLADVHGQRYSAFVTAVNATRHRVSDLAGAGR
jgi:hypothetical protein